MHRPAPTEDAVNKDCNFQAAPRRALAAGRVSCESAQEVETSAEWTRREDSRAAACTAVGFARSAGSRPVSAAAMPMKGRFPIRRTLQYLGQGDVVFKDVVKVMTVNYNTHGKLGEGARSVRALRGFPHRPALIAVRRRW